MTQATRSLSEAARMNIRAKEASRQLNRRKEALRVIMVQNRCGLDQAIEIFMNRYKDQVPDDVLADLESIRKEMKQDGKTAAFANVN